MFNDGVNPDTASDATVQAYADHYFEYDPLSREVTKEVSAVCDSCPGGGTTSDTFAYTSNPRAPAGAYNVWSVKAVQSLPDGATVTVYSNYVGLPMLRVYTDAGGTRKWCTFYRYDADANVIWEAQPSAVSGYDDSYDDLLHYNGGTGLYQYLRNSDGLINVTDYYASTNVGSGQVKGYVSARKVRRGQSGTRRAAAVVHVHVPHRLGRDHRLPGRHRGRLPGRRQPGDDDHDQLQLHLVLRDQPGVAADDHAAGGLVRPERLRGPPRRSSSSTTRSATARR